MTTSTSTLPSPATLQTTARRFVSTADQSVQFVGHLIGHIDSIVKSVGRDGKQIAEDSRALASALHIRFEIAKRGIQASPKALRVAKVLLVIATKYRLELGRSEVSTTEANQLQSDDRLQQLHRSSAAAIKELCIESRGTFLKVGQFLSMRPDLLPKAYIEELSTLRDQVPGVGFSQISEVIEKELEKPLSELFASIDETPVAAASLAQVHRALGHNGQHYAIKVQLPQAAAQFESDLAILRALSLVLADTLPFDIDILFSQLARSISQELDYLQEAKHCQNLKALLAPLPGILVPTVIHSLSTKKVLTMHWMPGKSLDIALKERSADGKKQVLTRLVDCFARQLLQYGYFHADPHSGNILVQDDNTIVLLDFGCSAKLSDTNKNAYKNLMGVVLAGKKDKVHRELQRLGFTSESEDKDAVEELVDVLLHMLKQEGAIAQWAADPQAASEAMLDAVAAVPGLKTPAHFVLVGRVLATLGGLLIEHSDLDISLPTLLAGALR